jgi:acyl-CoA thioester hydrolase
MSSSRVLDAYGANIETAWIDYNGHLRDAYYGVALSNSIDAVMDQLGLDAAYRSETRCTLYTLEQHIHFLHEVKLSDELLIENLILDYDHKRIHLGSIFRCERVPEPVAIAETMLLHVLQADQPGSAPFPGTVATALQALKLTADARASFGPSSRKIELKRR